MIPNVNAVNRTFTRIIAALGLFALMSLNTAAHAGPADPRPRTFTQPTGAVIQVHLKGDEFLNWAEDAAGNLIVFDADRKGWCYANWTDEGSVSTGEFVAASAGSAGNDASVDAPSAASESRMDRQRAKGRDIPQSLKDRALLLRREQDAGLREIRAQTLRGVQAARSMQAPAINPLSASSASVPQLAPVSALKRNLLVIHATWSDRTGIHTPKLNGGQIYDSVFNPSANSVNRYYKELFGAVEDIIVPAANINNPMNGRMGVVEVTLPGRHPGMDFGSGRGTLWDAISGASLTGAVDYSLYDTDDNGILEPTELSIGVIVDGYDGGAAFGYQPGIGDPSSTNNVRIQTSYLNRAFPPSYSGNTADYRLEIGGICHELGHSSYGFEDTYDHGLLDDGYSSGHGYWSLMSVGMWASKPNEPGASWPGYVDAYNLVISGCVVPGVISSSTDNITINSHLDIYRVNSNASDTQYFLLQQRKYGATDNYDRGTFYSIDPSPNPNMGGLLIFHIDEAVLTGNMKNTHYRTGIVEAHGGLQHLRQGLSWGDLNDLWGTSYRLFTDATDPSSSLYSRFTEDIIPPDQNIWSGVEIRDIAWNRSLQNTTFSVANTSQPSYLIYALPALISFGVPPAAQTVTITNIGANSITLTQPTAVYYDIGPLSATTLAPGAKATFDIRPKANLPVGAYDETITIVGSNGVSAAVNASFAGIYYDYSSFVKQVESFRDAAGDMTIELYHDFTMTGGVSIPENPNGATLTIRSANPQRPVTITRGHDGWMFSMWRSAAKLVLEHVIIDGNKEAYTAGNPLMFVADGSAELTMKDGAVLRNSLLRGDSGWRGNAVILLAGSKFTMTGGEISGNTGNHADGGVVFAEESKFTMTGGRIFNNAGIGVRAHGSSELVLGGRAVISDNIPPDGNPAAGLRSDVYLDNGAYITLSTAAPPEPGMEVGVTTQTPTGVIVPSGAREGDADRFFANEPGKAVVYRNNQLVIANIAVPVTGVTLNKAATTLAGGAEQLTATVLPANATSKAVIWSSSNSAVATVANGLVTAIAPGTATIAVTTRDRGYQATCVVTVAAVIEITNPPTGLVTGETATFQANVIGLDNSAVTWSASAGTINPTTGAFTAPTTAQIVAITAASVEMPAMKAEARVKITSANFDGNSKTNPQLLDLANAIGSTNPSDIDKYDLNNDGKIDDEDIRILFKAMGWQS